MLFLFMSQPDFACNPHALYEYVRDHTEHETAWLIKKDERYYELANRKVRCAAYNTIEGNQLLSEADYVITNSYTFPQLTKKENQIFVNLWHGSGIKAHDFYNHDISPEYAGELMRFFEKIDLLCVHSLDDRFKLSAQLHYDLRKCYVTGQPRLDYVRKSDGHKKLRELLGERLDLYKKLIFFAPSFRANGSSHSGTFFSDNIFRLDDYVDEELNQFLEKNQAALIYKLHPIEQTAFSGRDFCLNQHCYELTDQLLFEKDIRYDELSNAFDVMISDYSSIAFDYLLLDRPIVYLIPDYEEYLSQKGFVFHKIDMFMPGDKAFHFAKLLSALEDAFTHPGKYQKERAAVLNYRFDYRDDQSAKRCYETIIHYKKLPELVEGKTAQAEKKILRMPSTAELLERWMDRRYQIIDATKDIPEECNLESIKSNSSQTYLYITEEKPRELRKLTGRSTQEIEDIAFYYDVIGLTNVKICHVHGGVDYDMFSAPQARSTYRGGRRRIGFAGIMDNRIYFAMVQCICEVFSEYDIIFAGEHTGKNTPAWMKGFNNLSFETCTYEELPAVIQSFDIAILPFFGRHRKTVPKEYFQYLACGKQVVASAMENLPKTPALYCSASLDEAVENIKLALSRKDDEEIIRSARQLAAEYDWKRLAENLTKSL
ncbi:MAG: CDP-glycerol glycerophosphotransferase family protein [Bacteroidales bacterium]|nr:CDP-glycerol glycerophosphotransferase family protein [Bacteroidales bacterium]